MSSPSGKTDYERLIKSLLSCLGITETSFQQAIAWSLCEHMVTFLSQDRDEIEKMKNDPQFLAKFGIYLREKTRRKWSVEDAAMMRTRLLTFLDQGHQREPISYENWLRLLFTTPLRCAKCGQSPPAVTLEIDHIFPASKGGSSAAWNLRFLCMKHNRAKSAKLEVGAPWLSLR
jgi:hypothetical protein